MYELYCFMHVLCAVNICPEDGRVNRNCFNRAQAFIYRSLEERYNIIMYMLPYESI